VKSHLEIDAVLLTDPRRSNSKGQIGLSIECDEKKLHTRKRSSETQSKRTAGFPGRTHLGWDSRDSGTHTFQQAGEGGRL
jgi:hypothetical protein